MQRTTATPYETRDRQRCNNAKNEEDLSAAAVNCDLLLCKRSHSVNTGKVMSSTGKVDLKHPEC